ncbi:MAG: AraC family transcriptional regulator [Eubacterium sp.]
MDNSEYVYGGEYGKRGYLNEDFRIFNIKDKRKEDFEFHYHDFDKIVFFISGDVKYIIEGKEYRLQPYDLLLVPQGDIHKPIINPEKEYERIIIWINNSFFEQNKELRLCFQKVKEQKLNLIRSSAGECARLLKSLTENRSDMFAAELMESSLFIQLMIVINRVVLDNGAAVQFYSDKAIDKIIEYINDRLFDELSIDGIAETFYISRYHLMHKFKAATGKTVYSYIQTKRLQNAMKLLNEGFSAKEACFESGYRDYSVFLKAFKKEFGATPSEIKNIN